MPDYITIDDSPEKPSAYKSNNYPASNGQTSNKSSAHRMLDPTAKRPQSQSQSTRTAGTSYSNPARSGVLSAESMFAPISAPSKQSSSYRPETQTGGQHYSNPQQSNYYHPRDVGRSHAASGHTYHKAAAQPAKPLQPSVSSFANTYDSYIRPQTAFTGDAKPKAPTAAPTYRNAIGVDTKLYQPKDYVKAANGFLLNNHAAPAAPAVQEEDGERFDLNAANITAKDLERVEGDSEKHMRELLSGAIGEVNEDIEDGDDVVEGFSDSVRLMPHQVVGVKWMKGREKGRKYGGILADDMGLGKTVQTLARIVEGVATSAERKAGFTGGTLIVAPLAVMEQWATEVRSKTLPGELKVTTHHGPARAKTGKALEKFDVVITTYQTMASEWPDDGKSSKKNKATALKAKAQPLNEASDSDSDSDKPAALRKAKSKARGPLFQVKWLRIVLDEAQNIKNDNTKAAKSATALEAKYRWCLTGTPIQNSVLELYSLFRFLRIRPLDDWDLFRDRIQKPMNGGQVGLAMKRLHLILKAIMLRRTKTATIDGKPILNLPKRTLELVPCHFEADEQAFYDALAQQSELTFNSYLKAGTAMRNWTNILTMLLRLRQACDHPQLVTEPKKEEDEPAPEEQQVDELADMLGGLGVEGGVKCDVCFTSISTGTRCETCADLISGSPPDKHSAKIRSLIQILCDIRGRGEGERTIVFSQFTSFLNLVEPHLRVQGIKFCRYDGSMRQDQRLEALEKIRTGICSVILISFKAGSTGLNLTCCNNVVLMDMWWNPALEDQAFDRAHRLGQTRDVMIYKLRVENTIEDRILELQDKKRELADAALTGDTKGMSKLTLNDVINLFRRSE